MELCEQNIEIPLGRENKSFVSAWQIASSAYT